MEREAPLFLEARTWKVLETIFDRKSSQALRKSIVKALNFDPKTYQNRAQDAPKSRSGGDSAGNRFSTPNRSPLVIFSAAMPRPRHRACSLGGVLGRPGGVLGASWARLGAVLGVLGRLRRVLGLSWGRLGAHFIANST